MGKKEIKTILKNCASPWRPPSFFEICHKGTSRGDALIKKIGTSRDFI